MSDPLFDITKLSTSLYGMGFERSFLSECEYQYCWHFASLFPALHDGTFSSENRTLGESRGQAYLRGFATLLCGTFADASHYRTHLNDQFEQSLLNDGYQFIGTKLVETRIDTSVPAELAALPNKEILLTDVARQYESGEPVAALFMDLDHFKQVNDRISHAEGDWCLGEVVRVTSAVLVRKGKLYRIGGDEFGGLLPNFSASEAVATAERVRTVVDALEPFAGVVKVTASIGVAVSDAIRLRTPEALVSAADEAMYVAKFTTANRVCLWPPEPGDARSAEAKRRKSRRS